MDDNIKQGFKEMIDELEIDLQSSIKEVTDKKYVTQIYHGGGGTKGTYSGIEVKTIKQGQFTKFRCRNGAMVMINDENVLMVEVFEEE